MGETKSLWASKTFWGIIASLAGSLLPRIGIPIDESMAGQIIDWGLIAGGGAYAIYGRIKAKTRIGR